MHSHHHKVCCLVPITFSSVCKKCWFSWLRQYNTLTVSERHICCRRADAFLLLCICKVNMIAIWTHQNRLSWMISTWTFCCVVSAQYVAVWQVWLRGLHVGLISVHQQSFQNYWWWDVHVSREHRHAYMCSCDCSTIWRSKVKANSTISKQPEPCRLNSAKARSVKSYIGRTPKNCKQLFLNLANSDKWINAHIQGLMS